MRELHELTDLQLRVLEVLWAKGPATANEVHDRLEPELGLSRKTIGTILHRLEKQRVLGHTREGREYRYRARVTREQVGRAKLDNVSARLFGGRTPELISFALEAGDVDGGDAERIRNILAGLERK